MSLASNERPDKSITKFEFMLKTDDVYFFDAEDFEDIIHHYLNNGKINLAKKAIKLGLEQHPNSIEIRLLHVEVLVFENNLEKAESILDELQHLDGNNEEIYIQRANIHSKQDDHTEAIRLLNMALELTNDSFDIHSLLGMEYLFMDDFKLAKENFMRCVSYDEQDYSSLYNVIYCFEFLDDHDGAITYLNDYLDRNPYCEVAWHQLGQQYYAKKLYREALTAFDFAIISDDNFIGAYFEKGRVLEKLGKFKEAIENYEATVKIESPSSQAYLRLGKCHEKLQNWDEAKNYYYQTVHEDPLLDKGWFAITDFHFKKGEYEKALSYINKALNIDGENAGYWKLYGKINLALGHIDQADYAYRQAVELGEDHPQIWLKWIEVSVKGNEPQTTVEILDRALSCHPRNAKFHYKKAGWLMVLQDYTNARLALTKAVQCDRNGLEAFFAEFPQAQEVDWVRDTIAFLDKASK